MEFLVDDDGIKFLVDLNKRLCQCKFWDVSGLPCRHVLSCISYLRLDISQFTDNYYTKTCYQICYGEIIHPVPDLSMVEIHENPQDLVLPPVLKRLPGRPRKNRKKEVGEVTTGSGHARRSATVRCDTCKQFGHNKMTCQRAPVADRNRKKTTAVTAS